MRLVIVYEDQTYDSNGWGVPLSEATVWTSREQAERWVENIGVYGTVIEHPDPTSQPAPSLWIEGFWREREPVIPVDLPEVVWVAIYYPWTRSGGAVARPHSGDGIKTMLHSVSLSLAAQAERDGKPVLPPPRWMWMPLEAPIAPPRREQ